MAGSRKLSERDKAFKGYRPRVVKSGNIYKYIICISESEAEAKSGLATVRKKFPEAFMVRISGESVTAL